jgi:hypothetical protein
MKQKEIKKNDLCTIKSIILTSTNSFMNFEISISKFGLKMEEKNSWFQLRNSIQMDCMDKFSLLQHGAT